MKKYSKFKKILTAFLVANGALGWLLIFVATFMLSSYIVDTPAIADQLSAIQVILAAYGMTAFIIAAIYVGTPLMYDAMKDASRFKKPWGKSYLVERTNLIAYHDERSDMRNTIDILIVSNNIFWLACIFQAPFFGYFNKLIFFIILAFISSIITAIFVIIPISKYLLEHRVILHGGKTYSEVTRNDNDTNDKYRMK